MPGFLKRANIGFLASMIAAGHAFASQGPGVGNGTATTADQIFLGVGLIGALLAVIALDRRGRS